uniref:Uncharacterized protein n=1 Tax=Micromonas pusilla TaxID=38833 RepID=A0A7S0IAY5_MICPS
MDTKPVRIFPLQSIKSIFKQDIFCSFVCEQKLYLSLISRICEDRNNHLQHRSNARPATYHGHLVDDMFILINKQPPTSSIFDVAHGAFNLNYVANIHSIEILCQLASLRKVWMVVRKINFYDEFNGP